MAHSDSRSGIIYVVITIPIDGCLYSVSARHQGELGISASYYAVYAVSASNVSKLNLAMPGQSWQALAGQ